MEQGKDQIPPENGNHLPQINQQTQSESMGDLKDSPIMVQKIIQSTEQVINNQAIKIFELNQQISKLTKQNDTLKKKCQILIECKMNISVNQESNITSNGSTLSESTKSRQNDTIDHQKNKHYLEIDKFTDKILELEQQMTILKLQLAQIKSQSLERKLVQQKTKRKTATFTYCLSHPQIYQRSQQYIIPSFDIQKLRDSILDFAQKNPSKNTQKFSKIYMPWVKKTEFYLFPCYHNDKNKMKDKSWQLVKNGIPQDLREYIWPIIFDNKLGITITLYTELLKHIKDISIVTKKVSQQIDKDISRSFYSRTQFHTKIALNDQIKQILQIFHVYRPDISYVQGMTYPVIILNLVVGKYRAFVIFANLIICNLFFRRMFTFQGNYVWVYCRVFQNLLKDSMPNLYQHLVVQRKIQAEVYLIQWFYTFFSRGFTYQTTLQIWDILAYQQQLFFYKLGLCIFEQLQNKLLSSGYEDTITLIIQFYKNIECDEKKLFERALNHKLTPQKFQKMFDKVNKQDKKTQ